MNSAITLGFKGDASNVIIGSEVALDSHRRSFKSLRSDPAMAKKYDEIQLWTSSGGRTKRYKFKSGTHVNTAAKTAEPIAAETANAEPVEAPVLSEAEVTNLAHKAEVARKPKKVTPVKPAKKGAKAPESLLD